MEENKTKKEKEKEDMGPWTLLGANIFHDLAYRITHGKEVDFVREPYVRESYQFFFQKEKPVPEIRRLDLYVRFGICGSGYTWARWGHMDIIKVKSRGTVSHLPSREYFLDWIPPLSKGSNWDEGDYPIHFGADDNGELECTGAKQPVAITSGDETVKDGCEETPKDPFEEDPFAYAGESDDYDEKYYDGDRFVCELFSYSSVGGDGYYPKGGVKVNVKDFLVATPRAHKRPIVWLLVGQSGCGKSFLAQYLSKNHLTSEIHTSPFNLTVYETDSSNSLPDRLMHNVVVVGNRNQFSLDEIRSRYPFSCDFVKVDFSTL